MYGIIRYDGQLYVCTIDPANNIYRIPYHSKQRRYVEAFEEAEIFGCHLAYAEYKDAIETELFSEWIYSYSNEKRKDLRRMFNTGMAIDPANYQQKVLNELMSLVACPTTKSRIATVAMCTAPATPPAVNKETTMDTRTEAERTRAVFSGHLMDAYYRINNEAQRHFHLIDDEPPHTFDEYLTRIREKKFIVRDEKKASDPDYFYHGDAGRWIRWRDPKHTENKEGYNKFNESLLAKRTDTQRQILVADLPKLPDIVKEFESTTIH